MMQEVGWKKKAVLIISAVLGVAIVTIVALRSELFRGPDPVRMFETDFAGEKFNIQSLARTFDAFVPGWIEGSSVPGVAIAVIQHGEPVWEHSYGLADRNARKPLTPDTRFQVGSVSKVLTAWGVMALAEKGVIDLDASVDRYLKRWHLPESKFDNNGVTIRRVLSHTAGLSVRGYHGVFRPGDRLPSLEESLSGYAGSDGSLAVVQHPGAASRYSSGGYTALQLLIEDVTGKPFAAYMEQTVLRPLGMTQSGYGWSSDLESLTATPYSANGSALPQFQFVEQASGGLYTTISDLARLVSAAMHAAEGSPGGRGVLRPASVEEMITPASNTGGAYGLGYEILRVSPKISLVGCRGSNEGWKSLFLFRPNTGDGIVFLSNSDTAVKIMDRVICTWAKWADIEMSELCN